METPPQSEIQVDIEWTHDDKKNVGLLGQPIPVVQPVDNKAIKLLQTELDEILSKADGELFILTAVGESYHKNSIVLNFCLKYLATARFEDDWIGYEDINTQTLTGFDFAWARERDLAETRGIWIWSEPIIIQRQEKEVAVFLLNAKESITGSSYFPILGLSMMLSSSVVINTESGLDDEDHRGQFVTALRVLIDYGKSLCLQNYHAFQKVAFLLWNWKNLRRHTYGAASGELVFDVDLKTDNFSWSMFKKCCSKLLCFLLPSPGTETTQRDFAGRLSDFHLRFVPLIETFVAGLFASNGTDGDNSKMICGNVIKKNELISFATEYCSKLENEYHAANSDVLLEATAKVLDDLVLQSAIKDYFTEMRSYICANVFMSDESLYEMNSRLRLGAIVYLKEAKRLSRANNSNEEVDKKLDELLSKEFVALEKTKNELRAKLITEAKSKALQGFREVAETEFMNDDFMEPSKFQEYCESNIVACVDEFKSKFEHIHSSHLDLLVNEVTSELRNVAKQYDSINSARFEKSEATNSEMLSSLVEKYKELMNTKITVYQAPSQLEKWHKEGLTKIVCDFSQAEKRGNEEYVRKLKNELIAKVHIIFEEIMAMNETRKASIIDKSNLLMNSIIESFKTELFTQITAFAGNLQLKKMDELLQSDLLSVSDVEIQTLVQEKLQTKFSNILNNINRLLTQKEQRKLNLFMRTK